MNIRLATENDLPLIMAWRSSPLIFRGFFSQVAPLVWDEHVKWFRARNQDWRCFIVLFDDRPIGLVNIGQLDNFSPEVGYTIGEVSLWGKGLGTEAVKLSLDWLREYSKTHRHITHVHTTIKDDNIGSIKLIQKLGFRYACPAREGESRWERKL